MNKKGHVATLVPAHPGNLNAVTSGAYVSPRLIEARAAEIIADLGIGDGLDVPGWIVLIEMARLLALIEAIDRDLSERGVTDRHGKERYLVQRRERFSRQLIQVTQRLQEAQLRTRKQVALDGSGEVVGELADYVRELQAVALGRDPEARTVDRLTALKILLDLGSNGTTSHFERMKPPRYLDDPEFQADRAALEAELEEAEKEAHLGSLRRSISAVQLRAS